jgi:hypothetical protein
MTEIHIIPGKHTCGRIMDMRIIDDKKDRPFWIIYGICKKCEMVIVSNIFTDVEPIQGVDYIIDYTKICEKVIKDKNMKLHKD